MAVPTNGQTFVKPVTTGAAGMKGCGSTVTLVVAAAKQPKLLDTLIV